MDFIDKIVILIFVLQAVYSLYQRVTGGNAGEKAAEMPPPDARNDDGTFALVITRARQQVTNALKTQTRVAERVSALAARLGGVQLAPFRAAVDGPVTTELDRIEAGLSHITTILAGDENDPETMMVYAQYGHVLGELMTAQARLGAVVGALDGAARWREDAALGDILADVDTVAAATFAPLANAAKRGALQWPAGAPLAMPEVFDAPAVRAVLADHPVVFLDGDVVDEQLRWPVVIEALAHTVTATVPDLLAVPRAMLGYEPAWLPRQQGQRIVFDLQATIARWLQVIATDVIAAVIAGPVALQGLMTRFARPDDPYVVVRVRPGDDHRQVGSMPPPHLRVHVMAAVLTRLGFDVEASALRTTWDADHDHPQALAVPSLFGSSVRLNLAATVEMIAELAVGIATERNSSLGSRSWFELTGFDMSPGTWSRTRKRADDLLTGKVFRDDARVIACAAIVAGERRGIVDARLHRLVHRLIQSKGESAVPDPHYRPARGDRGLGDRLTARDLVESVVLGAVLRRPHAQDMPGTPTPPQPPGAPQPAGLRG